jgi:hypothetical protein
MFGCCCAARNPTLTPVIVDADWGCTCRTAAVPCQAQHAPRSAWTPTWGCTCRVVDVPRQTQHAPRSAWTPTGAPHVGLLLCHAKPNTHPSPLGRRLGLHISGCCRAAQDPTRTPISVDADRGCACRAFVVPRQAQHAPQSACTPTGVAHVGLLLCRAKPNTHPRQRGAAWGCTCRAVDVPRQAQHAPRSAWAPAGVAHVWLLMCRTPQS